MSVPYDSFAAAFLGKIHEYDFIGLEEEDRTLIVDGYMKKALASFRKICLIDFLSYADDEAREFAVNVPEDELEEILDIVSEGMLVHWMKPYLYKQENLQNVLNTRDFTSYSPANLLQQVGNAYAKVQKDFTNRMREYSYAHGDLTVLHT